jgi:hypothetical protein
MFCLSCCVELYTSCCCSAEGNCWAAHGRCQTDIHMHAPTSYAGLPFVLLTQQISANLCSGHIVGEHPVLQCSISMSKVSPYPLMWYVDVTCTGRLLRAAALLSAADSGICGCHQTILYDQSKHAVQQSTHAACFVPAR